MSVLELARKAYAKVKVQRNGHGEASVIPGSRYDINDINDQSPDETPLQSPPSYDINDRNDQRSHLLVDSPAGLAVVVTAMDGSAQVGLDVETTGLDPRTDRIRLLSLSLDTIDGGSFAYLVDCFAANPAPLFESLAEKELLLHHAAFDLRFLARLGFEPGKVQDTMILSQLLDGTRRPKGYHTLRECVQRHLDHTLAKELQKADWSKPLTAEHLDYAAGDVQILRPLHEALTAKLDKIHLRPVVDLEMRCLPTIVWMAGKGVLLDRPIWEGLASYAATEADDLVRQMNVAGPAPAQRNFAGGGWNWDSPVEVRKAFSAAGVVLESTADDALAAVDHPLADLLRSYRAARKRCTTYGTDWLSHVTADGRIYPTWVQLGADSGRMSCRDPNMQQLPRGKEYRSCVQAPPGRLLVKADYSQIELRIAAKISGDEALLEAYCQGQDLHTLTAQHVLGIADVSKDDRQLAKALNFGLLYGMGAKGFRLYAKSNYGVNLTLDQASTYRQAFFQAYPGLDRWHQQVRRKHACETRTLAGRRRILQVEDSDTLRLNTPVQGTGADGLKLALALLWERRREVPGVFPVLAVHDEIVIECDADQGEIVGQWLRKAMLETMTPLIHPVPVEVEVKMARTWGGD